MKNRVFTGLERPLSVGLQAFEKLFQGPFCQSVNIHQEHQHHDHRNPYRGGESPEQEMNHTAVRKFDPHAVIVSQTV